jgi:hypothetical protein
LCPRESQGTTARLLQHNKKISESNVTLPAARGWVRTLAQGAPEGARSLPRLSASVFGASRAERQSVKKCR